MYELNKIYCYYYRALTFYKNKLRKFLIYSIFTPPKGEEKDDKLYCPTVFDGFSCWNRTPAGTIAWQRCPRFVNGFHHKQLAFKK